MNNYTLLRGPFSSRSGYGDKARGIARSFLDLGHTVKLVDTPWGSCPTTELVDSPLREYVLKHDDILSATPDVYVNIDLPNTMEKVGALNILFTSGVEATAISPEWINVMNQNADLVIVPSTFVRDVFESTEYRDGDNLLKLTVPVEVIPESYDETLVCEPGDMSILNDIRETFCFLHVGQWIDGPLYEDRKDIARLVKTFLETFRNTTDAPALILKTSGASTSIIDYQAIQTKIDYIKASIQGNLPSVYVLHGDLTSEEMHALYTHSKVKCFVTFTRGEGFGRPILEATVLGLPVVASGWSGHVDFLKKEYSTLLPGKLVGINTRAMQPGIFVAGSQWFSADYSAARNVLYDVRTKYNKYASNAKRLRPINRAKYSHKKVTGMLSDCLTRHTT